MSNQSPLFSIVIPTRNRGHLIRCALQSALDQTVGDYEIVVSNNCSEDDTERVVGEFSDDRIRYFRTDRVLGMPDSWEFALGKARGEWVTYLADDDAISSRLLSSVVNAIEELPSEVVTWRALNYWNDTAEPRRRNQYVFRPFTSRNSYVKSASGLKNLYAFRHDYTVPRMLNTFCHRRVIERVQKRIGRFFLPPAPDYTVCAAMLAVIDKFTFIDIPLSFAGAGQQNPAGSPDSFAAFISDLKEEGIHEHAPIKVTGPCNTVYDSIFKMKSIMPEELGDIPVDIDNYLKGYSALMSDFKSLGFNMAREKKALADFIHKQPLHLRLKWRVQMALAAGQRLLSTKLKKMMLGTPLLLKAAEPLFKRNVVRGEDAGFVDILGAIRHFDQGQLAGNEISR